jgi:hypothetical protein
MVDMVDMVDKEFDEPILQTTIDIAESIMAVAATEKSEDPVEFTPRTDHANRPSGEFTLGISEVFHLEGDYLLVKMHTGALDKNVPQIPRRKAKELLNKYAVTVSVRAAPLRSPGSKAASENNDEFMKNMIQTEMAARVERINRGDLIPAAELGERLSMSKQAVSRAASTGRMFSVEGPSGKKVFPSFFSDPRFDRSVLERVSKELGHLPGPSKLQFFTTGKVSLDGKSPLEAISQGQLDRVLAAATAFREH